jgi:hypothetical protein
MGESVDPMEARDKKRWAAFREDASEGHLFDEVSKGLASGAISRRRALKLTGAAILGSTGLLALFPGVAGAQTIVGGTQPAVVLAGGCQDARAINNRRCNPDSCGGNQNCFCAETVSGNRRCVNLRDERCPRQDECDSNGDCTGDQICIKVGGCCGNERRNDCVRPCS